MIRMPLVWLFVTVFVVTSGRMSFAQQPQLRRLPMARYVDKMEAGWIGQMVGVGWGGPTEFKYQGVIIPADALPKWRPAMVNQFNQDDIYVEMTFLRTLEQYGLDATIRQAGIDFANSGYRLWHANLAGRNNLRRGISPPDSSHPQLNKHADDIDYQIEADFSGLIAPGLPNRVIRLGETFGRLMNYGDGLYGGQFVGGMYAEAFFETDVEKIVRAGLKCIPAGSQYAESIRDVLQWWQESPEDWQKTWRRINDKYHLNPEYRRFSCTGSDGKFNIDAKINGAYIVMGLLYGEGKPDDTIVISTRCGQDSDCNPSNAGGILFATIGRANLPERFTSALDRHAKFSHTAYGFATLVEVCKKLARQAVIEAGGKIKKGPDGREVLLIPVLPPVPSALVQCWDPGPLAGSRFTSAQRAQIGTADAEKLAAAFGKFAPGWKITRCGDEMDPGLRSEHGGKRNVFVTHPLNQETGAVLSRTVAVPAKSKAKLHLVVGHNPQGDWTLIVKANGTELLRKSVGPKTATDGWLDVDVDLSSFAGHKVRLELVNQPSGWKWEAGYWATIKIE
jgi:hypothetical protein